MLDLRSNIAANTRNMYNKLMPKRDIVQRRIISFAISGLLVTVFGILSVNALVNNSKEAKKRYDQLIAVDQAGGDVESSLTHLREFIYSHMNTTIGSPTGVYPPIQLKGTYDRLVAAEQAKLEASSATVYSDAQAECERRFPGAFFGGPRIPCITDYVTSHGVKLKDIPDGLYKFDFVSPSWSPDLAGWSLLALAGSLIALFINGFALLRYRGKIRRAF